MGGMTSCNMPVKSGLLLRSRLRSSCSFRFIWLVLDRLSSWVFMLFSLPLILSGVVIMVMSVGGLSPAVDVASGLCWRDGERDPCCEVSIRGRLYPSLLNWGESASGPVHMKLVKEKVSTGSLESSERALLLDRLLAALVSASTVAAELFLRRFKRDGSRLDASGVPPRCMGSDHCGSDGDAGTDVGACGSCSMRSAVTEGTLFFSLQGALILACIRAAIQYRRLFRILPTLVSCSRTPGPTALPVFIVALVSGVCVDTPPRARPWQIAPESYLGPRTVAPDARPEA